MYLVIICPLLFTIHIECFPIQVVFCCGPGVPCRITSLIANLFFTVEIVDVNEMQTLQIFPINSIFASPL